MIQESGLTFWWISTFRRTRKKRVKVGRSELGQDFSTCQQSGVPSQKMRY